MYLIATLILSANVSGMANSAVCLGVVTNLNNNKSSNIYFSANVPPYELLSLC